MTNEPPAETTRQDGCPEYAFPLAEPDYTSKLPRDLSSFDDALDAMSDQREQDIHSLLRAITIPEIQSLFDHEQLTSAELVTYYLRRIRRDDVGRLNAVLAVNPEALAAAAARDAERQTGAVRGPLHGIPLLLKDNIATRDMPTTAGAFALRDWRPGRDAFLAARLRDAGAIILGKANLSEFANYTDPCTPNGFSTLGGQTQSPWGDFDPLGSSSGSAVGVAASLAVAAVGTETAGSIIMPALVNGVVGLKTSRGLVSRDGIVPLLETQDVPGPMTRNVTDAAILLTAMRGEDPADPATAAAAQVGGVDFLSYASIIAAQAVRVGVVQYTGNEDPWESNDRYPAFDAATADRLARLLDEAGVAVRRVPAEELAALPNPNIRELLPYGFRDGFDGFMTAWGEGAPVRSLAEVVAVNAADNENRAPYGQRSIEEAAETTMTPAEFLEATGRHQSGAQQAMRALLARHSVEVLLVPPRFQLYPAAGFPALAVPIGLEANGRPQGVVFTGDFLAEPQLLAVGYALEQAVGGANYELRITNYE
jgi:amidase